MERYRQRAIQAPVLWFSLTHTTTAFKRNKKAELLRGSKKKRNEEKVKTEENCARASSREKLAKKVEVSFGSVFVRERTQSARAL